MPISAISNIKNGFYNTIYSSPMNKLPTNSIIDLSDPNDGKSYSYDELVILSNPKTSTQYLLDNTIHDYTEQIKKGKIPTNIPDIPIKQLFIYSNPITTSYEINKMAHDGRLNKQDAEKLNNTLLKNSIGYGLNII